MLSVYWYLVLAAGDTKENKRDAVVLLREHANGNLGDLSPWNTGLGE